MSLNSQAMPVDDTLRDPPGVMTRIRVTAGLLAGLRWRDITSAREFMHLRYGQHSWPVRIIRLILWSLHVMWCEVPNSLPWATLENDVSHTPFWLTSKNPVQNHPWANDPQARLPETAAVVVVGAGFGGAAVAYHWSKCGSEPLVLLERSEAASGSAGRNGGIVVMAGGTCHGYYVYQPVLRYLTRTQPEMSSEERDTQAIAFADVYVKAVHASHEMIARTIETERIDCDYARKGWMFFTDPVAQPNLEASFAFASRMGHSDWVRHQPDQVRERSGVNTSLDGAESQGSATWHPAKWVWGILKVALRNPNVELFTRTTVQAIERDGSFYVVNTDRGTIRTRHVVNATESHTPAVFKKFLSPFPDLITPYREQGMHAAGGPSSMTPQIGVSGPLGWFSRVASGGIVFGSDHTPVKQNQAGGNEPSRFITRFESTEIGKHWSPEPLRVTHEWTGTTSTTPDKYPVVGLMDDHGLYMLGGFAGAGSAVSFNAGETIVNLIQGRSCEPNYHPEQYFSPFRFTDPSRYGRLPT